MENDITLPPVEKPSAKTASPPMILKATPILFAALACSASDSTTRVETAADDYAVISVRDEAEGCFHSLKKNCKWLDQGESGYAGGSSTISHAEVQELRELLLAARFEPENLLELVGVTPEALEEHREQILELALPKNWLAAGARLPERFAEQLTYEHVASRVLGRLRRSNPFGSTNTQHFGVVIPGDPEIEVYSKEPSAWMLPWHISAAGESWTVVDPRVSQALLKLSDPEGPNAETLDGSEYWSEGLWADQPFWLSFVDEYSLAREVYSNLPGYNKAEQLFNIEKTAMGSVNLQQDSMYFELSARERSPIDNVFWWNSLADGKPLFDWNDFLEVHTAAASAVERQPWLVAWQQEQEGRTITLETVGKVGHS